ncbi:MAG: CsiV family protein [Venatoribacter sp.]
MLRFTLLLSTLLFASLPSQAASLYRVEVILFAYDDQASIDHETWPLSLENAAKEPDSDGLQWWLHPRTTSYNQAFAQLGFKQMPQSNLGQPVKPVNELLLENEAKRIDQLPNTHVVWHQAWIEPIQAQESAIPHPIQIDYNGTITIHIEGSLSLYRSRYLHFNTDLNVQHSQKLEDSAEETNIRAAHIQQSRRMRSGELHYVDHPMLGAVIKVIPVED